MAEPTDWSKYEGKTGTYNGSALSCGGVLCRSRGFSLRPRIRSRLRTPSPPSAATRTNARAVREMGDQFLGYNQRPERAALAPNLAAVLRRWVEYHSAARSAAGTSGNGRLTSKMLSATMIPARPRSMDSNAEMKWRSAGCLTFIPGASERRSRNRASPQRSRANRATACDGSVGVNASKYGWFRGFVGAGSTNSQDLRLNVRPPGVPPQAVFDPRTRRWKMP